MTASLPSVGGSVGSWGAQLNAFLSTAHNSDGTLVLPLLPGVALTASPNIVFDGDSLTQGTGALPFNNFPNGNDYPSQVVASLDRRGIYWNVGVGGEQTATMITNAPTVVDPKLVSGANNVVCFHGGTNDLQSTDNATTTYNRIVTYCQARQAAGWKVIVGTLTPRSDSGTPGDFDTQRLTVNSSIRANWQTFANGIADIGADAGMGTSGQETNTQYYNGDNVHHNPNGYRVLAGYFLAALSKLGITGHQHSDKSALISDLWLPATEFYPTSGSPTEALIGSYPTWSLHHGAVDAVAWTGLLPQDWLTCSVNAVWSNTLAASGNAILLSRTGPFTVSNFGANPTNLATGITSGGNQTVTSPVGYRTVQTPLCNLTLNNGDSPRVAWNIGVERNGSNGSDTLTTDVIGLLGVYIYRAT